MSFLSTIQSAAYEHHIFNQLEPDSVLRTGNAKRYKPVWAEKNELMDKMRKQDPEGFARMIEEEHCKQLNEEI